jgi:hypothetical protein
MPDTPRFFRYAVLVAMFPVAALGLVERQMNIAPSVSRLSIATAPYRFLSLPCRRFWPMPSSAGCFCLAPGAIVR